MDYRREIDGLRALAVVPVILFHAGLETFRGGFVGVDIFFVISGYLITTIILSELERGKFSIISFYERRARRILPALFLIMLLCILFAWFWLLPRDMTDFLESLMAVSVFSSNILFWHESGYFEAAAELKPLLHTWSLSVEEQYYVIFPLFLMLIWRAGYRWMLLLIFIGFVASLTLAQWASVAKPAAAFYLLPTRAWELVLGAFTAFYLSKTNHRAPITELGELGGCLGLALILFSVFTFSNAIPFPGFYALLPTVGAALIILFSTNRTVIGKLLGNKFFVGIGLISYSAYLWHQPLFAFVRYSSFGEENDFFFLILSGIAFVLAYFTWRFVESPFRNKNRFKRGTIFSLALTCSLFFVIFGYFGYTKQGYSQRFDRLLYGDIGHLEFHQYIDRKYIDCEPKSISEQAASWEGFLRCKQSMKGTPDIVLLGDSHAEHLFLGLAEARPDLSIAFYTLGGKPYVTNPQFNEIFEELLGNNKPQHIILTMHFVGKLNADATDLYEGFSTTIRALQSAGNSVSLVGDVPRFNKDPGFCAYVLPFQDTSSCDLPIADVEIQRRAYVPILQQLSLDFGVKYANIDDGLCDESKCRMTDGVSVFYRDNNHLNIPGSRIIGAQIAKMLFL